MPLIVFKNPDAPSKLAKMPALIKVGEAGTDAKSEVGGSFTGGLGQGMGIGLGLLAFGSAYAFLKGRKTT